MPGTEDGLVVVGTTCSGAPVGNPQRRPLATCWRLLAAACAGVRRHPGRSICRRGGGARECGGQGKFHMGSSVRTAPQMRCGYLWLLQGGQHWRERRGIRTPTENELPCCLLSPGPALQLPESGDLEGAAGLLITYGTAWLALRERADLRPGMALGLLGTAVRLPSVAWRWCRCCLWCLERQCRCCLWCLTCGAATLSGCHWGWRMACCENVGPVWGTRAARRQHKQLNGSFFAVQ